MFIRPHGFLLYYYLILSALVVCCRPSWCHHPTIISVGDSNQFEDANPGDQRRLLIRRSITSNEDDKCGRVAAGYLLSDSTDQRLLNMSDPLDRNVSLILDTNGPDMRPSRDYHDFKNITLNMSKRAWILMRKHASVAIADRIDLAWPTINQLLQEARVSKGCISSINETFMGAMRLESWAVQLINSWGSFPMSGLFEGTYGDVGSFHSCVNIKENMYIDHAHYCSVTFRPVMPSQADYELIVRKEPAELRFLFEEMVQNSSMRSQNQSPTGDNQQQVIGSNHRLDSKKPMRDAMTDLLEQAQYHHFLYYKWGTCWPIQCNPFDVRRVAKLVGRKNIFMSGPVKCYSKSEDDYEQEFDEVHDFGRIQSIKDEATIQSDRNDSLAATSKKRKLVISVWDKNDGIFIWKPHFNKAQKVAAAIIISVTIFIFTMTMVDLVVNKIPWLYEILVLSLKGVPISKDLDEHIDSLGQVRNSILRPGSATPRPVRKHPTHTGFQMVPTQASAYLDNGESSAKLSANKRTHLPATGLFMTIVDDCSIFSNFRQFFRVSQNQLDNDILCLHGIRCITMVWIIMTHTMMYNDWSAFARTREIEIALNSLLSQPLFNGSYLVDTFFLMSGLLSALTAFKHCQGLASKFNSFAYIFGRWLRLTPQIFFMSMVYIVLPSWSYGPHWFPMTSEYSENCVKNWWINVLHLQAFYKTEEMCNFVTWWISIDFFYHFFALALIWVILMRGHRWGFWSMVVLVFSQIMWQSKRHYELELPPNVLSTIPQTGAMWTTMTLEFYWTPYTHSVPFFFGFYIGYLMALKTKVVQKHLNTRRALIGWFLAIFLLLGQSYSTYWWVTGKAGYSKLVSTLFFAACSLIWAGSICWIIIACQHGYGGFVNRVLSWKVFIVLGKASYLIYLSHFQILFLFFANQNLMIEPTTITMLYIIFGNIFISTLYGIFWCCIYEIPWLKFHRRLMKYV